MVIKQSMKSCPTVLQYAVRTMRKNKIYFPQYLMHRLRLKPRITSRMLFAHRHVTADGQVEFGTFKIWRSSFNHSYAQQLALRSHSQSFELFNSGTCIKLFLQLKQKGELRELLYGRRLGVCPPPHFPPPTANLVICLQCKP